MARSNWYTTAFNEKGETVEGVFTVGNVTVEAYKNWLYVRDPDAWLEHGGFSKPTIMEVTHGEIKYKNVSILAERLDAQSAIVFAITTGWKHNDDFRGIYGSCGYGYDDHNWIGMNMDNQLDFLQFLEDLEYVDPEEGAREKIRTSLKKASYNQGTLYLYRKVVERAKEIVADKGVN